MQNSDMPAMPLSNEMSSDLDSAIGSPAKYGLPTAMGLSKREHFAAMAMQGLLSNPAIIDTLNDLSYKYIANSAAVQADALLERLENELG